MMRKLYKSLAAGGLALMLTTGPAQATLIGDTYNLDIQLGGNVTFTDNTQIRSFTPIAPGGAGACIRAAGSSQVCSSSGISMGVSVGASSINFSMFGSTGSTGSIDWLFTGLDFANPAEFIIGVTPAASNTISVTGFGPDSVSFRTTNTNFVGIGNFSFTLQTAVPEPAPLALMALGLLTVSLRRRS